MTPGTATIPGETGTVAQGVPSPPQGRPRSRARRAVLAWAAIVAACAAAAALALVVRTDGGDDADLPATRPAPHADQVDHEAHLVGQARTYGDADTTNDRQPGEPSTGDFLPGSRRVPIR
jgi:hypothetical protein